MARYKYFLSTNAPIVEKYRKRIWFTMTIWFTIARYTISKETVAMNGMLIAVLSDNNEFSLLRVASSAFFYSN